MQIIVAKKPNAVVLGIEGNFNAGAVPEFERVFNRHLESGGRCFILNMAGMSYISSAGLCSILAAAKKADSLDGKLMICALQGEALNVFEISGFASLFTLYPTEAEALKEA